MLLDRKLESWYFWSYGAASRLQFGTYILESQQGVQQGDPLSGLLFSLAIHPCISALASLPGIIWSGWFYDDGTLHGSAEALQLAYSEAIRLFASINLQVNAAKSKLWVSRQFVLPSLNIRQLSWEEGWLYLGTPFGLRETEHHMENRLNHLRKLCEQIILLGDTHVAYHLLRYCAPAGKIVHILRTVPCHRIQHPASNKQPSWVSRVAMKKRIASMNMRTPRDAIRISCLADTHSGDWLHATPSQKLGLWLQNTDFVRALRFRLGLPKTGYTRRHYDLVHVIRTLLALHGVPVLSEQTLKPTHNFVST